MGKILVRVREVPGVKEPKLRKPGAARRYWTRTPEPADDADPVVARYLQRGQLELVPERPVQSKKTEGDR